MVGPSPATANSAGLEQTHVLSLVRPRRAPGHAALCPACAGPTVSRGSLRASPPPRSPCPRPPRPQGWCPSRPPSPPWRGSWAHQPSVPASHLPMLRTPPGLPRAVPSRTPGSRAHTAAHVSGPTSRGPRLGAHVLGPRLGARVSGLTSRARVPSRPSATLSVRGPCSGTAGSGAPSAAPPPDGSPRPSLARPLPRAEALLRLSPARAGPVRPRRAPHASPRGIARSRDTCSGRCAGSVRPGIPPPSPRPLLPPPPPLRALCPATQCPVVRGPRHTRVCDTRVCPRCSALTSPAATRLRPPAFLSRP